MSINHKLRCFSLIIGSELRHYSITEAITWPDSWETDSKTNDPLSLEETFPLSKPKTSQLVFQCYNSLAVSLNSQWRFGFGSFAAAHLLPPPDRSCQKRGYFPSRKTLWIDGECMLFAISLDQLLKLKQWMLRPEFGLTHSHTQYDEQGWTRHCSKNSKVKSWILNCSSC